MEFGINFSINTYYLFRTSKNMGSNKSKRLSVKQPAVDSTVKEIENAISKYSHEMDEYNS